MIKGLLFSILIPCYSFCQPNCNIYKLNGNDSCYQACVVATSGWGTQGSKLSQMRFDQSISMCPDLDYAYMEKAVPYLKRGDFAAWRKLIDKAVDLNPKEHLGYRGWCRYQFLKDYEGAISDIELLDSLKENDIGYAITGDYHLNVAKALCYKAIGRKQKAIQIIEDQLAQKGYEPMLYDYLHLGVLKIETGKLEEGVECLNKSILLNDYYAEAYYYRGLAYKRMGKIIEFKQDLEKSYAYYLKNNKLFDPYSLPMDKIFLSDIKKELEGQ